MNGMIIVNPKWANIVITDGNINGNNIENATATRIILFGYHVTNIEFSLR